MNKIYDILIFTEICIVSGAEMIRLENLKMTGVIYDFGSQF